MFERIVEKYFAVKIFIGSAELQREIREKNYERKKLNGANEAKNRVFVAKKMSNWSKKVRKMIRFN